MYAIYARQSVDRIDSISIETQIEFCKYETRGEAYKTYIDKGFSGKNTDRPEFQRLVDDIKKGLITKVVVYKLDRVSRSILDFSNLMALFQEHQVEFISSTEKFDTSTPMGRAMLNICIVFAQLERETIQKRVTDAYFSRIRKGFYMGGRVPYGFNKVDTVIQGVKTFMYEINHDEAEHIKLMFEIYSQFSTSYSDILRYFEEHNIYNLRLNKPFVRCRIHEYLVNPVYVRADERIYEFYKQRGVEIVNSVSDFIGTNGCYYYAGQGVKERKHTEMKGNILVLAPHAGFIDASVWLDCRRKLLRNKQIATGRRVTKSWLAGKIKCGNCGYALSRKDYYHNPVQSYYMCSRRINDTKACIGCGTIYADEFEALILKQIKQKLDEFETLQGKARKRQNPKIASLQKELEQIEEEIQKLLASLTSANDVLIGYINKKAMELDSRKKEVLDKLAQAQIEVIEESKILKATECIDHWEELTLDDKRQVCDTLIEVIYATSEKLQIQWKF